jgi:hypothetical protein
VKLNIGLLLMKIIEYCEIKHRTFVDENRNTEKLNIGLLLMKIGILRN